MPWRYQPVYQVHAEGGEDEKIYSLCEVYLSKDGSLSSWTSSPAMEPAGIGDIDDLRGALARMLVDAYRWEPVEFSTLKPGMTFKRVISQEQSERVAGIIAAMGSAATSPQQ